MSIGDARATIVIAALTAAASLLILVAGILPQTAIMGGFIPLRFDGVGSGPHAFPVPALLTPLTATLIHGGLAHVAFNLVMFVFCGMHTERAVGAGGIVILYVIGAFAAALGHWAFEPMSAMPMIGASGAISAIVGAYSLLYGQRRGAATGALAEVLHVAWLAAAWIGIQLLVGVAGMGGMGAIAIGAHIGGFVAGLILARPLLRWHYRGA